MAESKGESKGSFVVVDKVYEFCTSTEFEGAFEAFSKEYSDVFIRVLDFSPTDEHPLEFHNVYREYLSRFEAKIERFILDEGYEPIQFYRECQELLSGDEVYGHRRFFIEALLATSEYDSFFLLMKNEMEKFRPRK